MTVYVEHTPAGADPGRDLVWARLWADTLAEATDFATRLGVSWPAGRASTVISEAMRRRAILMGAIPAQRPAFRQARGAAPEVAA